MKKKIIIVLVIYLLGFLTPIIYTKIKSNNLKNKVIYTITIETEVINLRPEIDLSSDVIRQVFKGEQFEVVSYHEGTNYNWYEVIYEEGKTGWLASGKKISWVSINKEEKTNE